MTFFSLLNRPCQTIFQRYTQKLFLVRNMSIKVGDKIPSIDLFENTPGTSVNMTEFCSQRKVLIFGVPGAFTPGCSKTHLPGYINKSVEIKSKGVSEIVCISVNDPFVMAAWGREYGADGKVRMLADTNAELTNKLGLGQNIEVLGGIRSKRFSMIVDNGEVIQLNVEPDGKGLSCSLAENVLGHL